MNILTRPQRRRRLSAALLLVAMGATCLPACRSCLPRLDAERAAEEREEAHQQLQSSLLVLPYRGMKTVIRAGALKPPPSQIVEVIALAEKASAEMDIEHPDVGGKSQQLVSLASAVVRGGAILAREEEDRYPLVWVAAQAGPLPAGWYDAAAEHLFFGIVDLALHYAGKEKLPIDWVYYEFERAAPQPGWPVELRLLAQSARGLMFLVAAKHYAAEEELGGYLDTLQTMSPDQIKELAASDSGSVRISGEDVHKQLRAFGHFSRSFNRFALKRDARGYEDLEAGLKLVKELGIDNELTDWVAISLALHKKDYAQASSLLEHLSQSPFLSEEDRAEVKACAASLSKLDKGFVLFGRERAFLVVARAGLARIGGVKAIVATIAVFIGPERAAKLARPCLLLWGVGNLIVDESQRAGHDAVDKSKELGKKGYNYLHNQVEKLTK